MRLICLLLSVVAAFRAGDPPSKRVRMEPAQAPAPIDEETVSRVVLNAMILNPNLLVSTLVRSFPPGTNPSWIIQSFEAHARDIAVPDYLHQTAVWMVQHGLTHPGERELQFISQRSRLNPAEIPPTLINWLQVCAAPLQEGLWAPCVRRGDLWVLTDRSARARPWFVEFIAENCSRHCVWPYLMSPQHPVTCFPTTEHPVWRLTREKQAELFQMFMLEEHERAVVAKG